MACMFPKTIVFYPMTPRRILIMLIWGTMAIYHAHCTAALSRESRLGLPSFAAFGGVPLSRKVSHTVLSAQAFKTRSDEGKMCHCQCLSWYGLHTPVEARRDWPGIMRSSNCILPDNRRFVPVSIYGRVFGCVCTGSTNASLAGPSRVHSFLLCPL